MTSTRLSRARLCAAAVAFTLAATAAVAQSPDRRYALRPIKCIAYDPQPSDFEAQKLAFDRAPGNAKPPFAYFDSDFFNGDYRAFWGDDGLPGARKELDTFKSAGLNLIHLYNWNARRQDHTSALDAAAERGIQVMVPISNYMWQTITNTGVCDTCFKGFGGAVGLLEGTFLQVYINGSKKPHPGAAMWGIFNEYDINGYDPQFVRFVAQAIITLENKYGIAPEDRLPITSPVSDGIFPASARKTMPRPLGAALDLAAQTWLANNPGKTESDLPGGVLATMAIAHALEEGQTIVTYRQPFEANATTVAAIPADFWKTRWIASTNPFRDAAALRKLITDPGQFQSGFPGTTAFNTLPPLFFGESGWSQANSGGVGTEAAKKKQAEFVLDQIVTTTKLSHADQTTAGYFLGACFFQHTFVDKAHFEAFEWTGQFETRSPPPNAPDNASGGSIRVDALQALPVWTSVQQGFASSLTDDEFADWLTGAGTAQ